MAIDLIPLIEKPDVGIMSGVPAVLGAVDGLSSLSSYGSFIEGATVVEAQKLLSKELLGNSWGLFTKSGTALFPNAMIFMAGMGAQAADSNAPLQDGSFVSYNKVQNPEQYQLGLSFQGSVSDKSTQLAALRALQKGTTLVTFRMPEITLYPVDVVGFNIIREPSRTADLLMVMVTLQEIRNYATTTYKKTQTGIGAITENRGTVQTQSPTSTQTAAIASGAA